MENSSKKEQEQRTSKDKSPPPLFSFSRYKVHFKPFGHADPSTENKAIFWVIIATLLATGLYILSFYF